MTNLGMPFAGLTSHSQKHWKIEFTAVRIVALAVLAVAIGLAGCTAINFFRRIRALE